MSRPIKIAFRIIAATAAFILLLVLGTMLYITFNKTKVLKLVNTQLNKDLDGTVTIGNMRPQFFKGFPDISLALEDVQIRDRRFTQHRHTLLDAKNFDVSINMLALFTGAISIKHIDISNAAIDIYTDSTGYSNSSVFKFGPKKKNSSSKSNTSATLEKFSLSNVGFKVEDQRANKLFNFIVNGLKGKITYTDSGWRAAFHLDVLAKKYGF